MRQISVHIWPFSALWMLFREENGAFDGLTGFVVRVRPRSYEIRVLLRDPVLPRVSSDSPGFVYSVLGENCAVGGFEGFKLLAVCRKCSNTPVPCVYYDTAVEFEILGFAGGSVWCSRVLYSASGATKWLLVDVEGALVVSSFEMAGLELAVRKTSNFNLREAAARATLREVRLRGHVYVELREVGKRIIFFCTLCLTPCFSDSALFDHLRGNLHAQRYATAKVTLFGPIPWPFNDGVLFFTSPKREQLSSVSNSQNDKILCADNGNLGTTVDEHEVTSKCVEKFNGNLNSNDGNSGLVTNCCSRVLNCNGNDFLPKDMDLDNNAVGLGIIENVDNHGMYLRPNTNGCGNLRSKDDSFGLPMNCDDRSLNCNGNEHHLMISDVLIRDEISILRLRLMGFGQIASSVRKANEIGSKIQRIWCAWLGEGVSGGDEVLSMTSKCDFAVVNFSYTYDLGRRWGMDDLNSLLSSGSQVAIEDVNSPRKRLKKSFSEPEGTSKGLNDYCGSSGEDSPRLNGCAAKTLFLKEDQSQRLSFVSNKAIRRELRRQKRLAAEKMCDICGQPMLPGKDVATLLNCKTGQLACSSRNKNGAFHVFHTSCLIHWILLCDLEIWTDKSANTKNTRGRKGRTARKTHISSIFCPECQGTGTNIEGDQLEKPTIPLSEMFLYKLKAIESHKSWMKNPELLKKCSTGLHFPCDTKETPQEKMLPLKLLHFYQAEN